MYLWFLLLGSGQLMHAAALPKNICEFTSFDFVTKHQVKYKKLDSSSVLIEEADIDLDEEFHSGDNLNKGNTNNFAVSNYKLLDNWYLTYSSQFQYKDNSKQFNFFAPYYGHDNPIYLEIGVLRI